MNERNPDQVEVARAGGNGQEDRILDFHVNEETGLDAETVERILEALNAGEYEMADFPTRDALMVSVYVRDYHRTRMTAAMEGQ
jgi:hypothetical protein